MLEAPVINNLIMSKLFNYRLIGCVGSNVTWRIDRGKKDRLTSLCYFSSWIIKFISNLHLNDQPVKFYY